MQLKAHELESGEIVYGQIGNRNGGAEVLEVWDVTPRGKAYPTGEVVFLVRDWCSGRTSVVHRDERRSSVGRGGRAQKNLLDRVITTSFPLPILLDGRGQSALQRPTGRPRLFDAAADSDVLAMSLNGRHA